MDPAYFALAIVYSSANWIEVGRTRGFARDGHSYSEHAHPKLVFLHPLCRGARARLRSRNYFRLTRLLDMAVLKNDDANCAVPPWMTIVVREGGLRKFQRTLTILDGSLRVFVGARKLPERCWPWPPPRRSMRHARVTRMLLVELWTNSNIPAPRCVTRVGTACKPSEAIERMPTRRGFLYSDVRRRARSEFRTRRSSTTPCGFRWHARPDSLRRQGSKARVFGRRCGVTRRHRCRACFGRFWQPSSCARHRRPRYQGILGSKKVGMRPDALCVWVGRAHQRGRLSRLEPGCRETLTRSWYGQALERPEASRGGCCV